VLLDGRRRRPRRNLRRTPFRARDDHEGCGHADQRDATGFADQAPSCLSYSRVHAEGTTQQRCHGVTAGGLVVPSLKPKFRARLGDELRLWKMHRGESFTAEPSRAACPRTAHRRAFGASGAWPSPCCRRTPRKGRSDDWKTRRIDHRGDVARGLCPERILSSTVDHDDHHHHLPDRNAAPGRWDVPVNVTARGDVTACGPGSRRRRSGREPAAPRLPSR